MIKTRTYFASDLQTNVIEANLGRGDDWHGLSDYWAEWMHSVCEWTQE